MNPVIEITRQYSDIYSEQVPKTVYRVFGEVAACKIALSQKLPRKYPKEINREYRREEVLTLSLMGLIAEDTLLLASVLVDCA